MTTSGCDSPCRLRAARDRVYVALLVGLVLATRWPLLSNREGEPDSGLFIEGLWRWLRYGPRVPEIYSKNLSPLYYWGLAALVRWLHVPAQRYPITMNRVSLVAALVTAPLLYTIARRWLRPAMSLASCVMILLGPGLWWLGIEPHPEGAAIAAMLAAIWAFQRAWHFPIVGRGGLALEQAPPARSWWIAATLFLALALLLRADEVLALSVFPALLLVRHRLGRRDWGAMALMIAVATLIFVVLRQQMLQASLPSSTAYTAHQTGGYIKNGVMQLLRSKAYILKQLLPMGAAPGACVSLLAAATLLFGMRRLGRTWGRKWGLLIAGWSVPGWLFWFLVLGNNIRHVTFLALPVIWAGCAAAERLWSPRIWVPVVAAALVADLFIIPPSSNVVLYASADVPASAHLLWQRQLEMQATLSGLVDAARRPRAAAASWLDPRRMQIPACFLGSYTTPYMLSFLLMRESAAAEAGTPGGMRVGPGWSDVLLGAPGNGFSGWIRFYEMYSEEEYRKLRPGCVTVASYEYDADGIHQRYLGKEWRHVPLEALWYPPRTTRPATLLPVRKH